MCARGKFPVPEMTAQGKAPMTLLTAPIELAGDWGRMIPDAAKHVGERMGSACFDGGRLTRGPPAPNPPAPCQGVEETMGEAFALRGLGLLADDWSRTPPFPDDSG